MRILATPTLLTTSRRIPHPVVRVEPYTGALVPPQTSRTSVPTLGCSRWAVFITWLGACCVRLDAESISRALSAWSCRRVDDGSGTPCTGTPPSDTLPVLSFAIGHTL